MDIVNTSYEMTPRRVQNKPKTYQATLLPQVGLYTCPMCQGRGVCTTSVGDFERKSSRLRTDSSRHKAIKSLDHNSSWLPEVPDISSNDVLQQIHRSSQVSYTSEPLDSTAFVSSLCRSDSSTHQSNSSANQSRSGSYKNLAQKREIDEHIQEIWPGIIAESERPSEQSRRPPTYTINLKEVPKVLKKAFYKRETVGQTGKAVALREKTVHASAKKSNVQAPVSDSSLLLEEARPLHPQETLRVAIMGLQSSEWEEVVQGLQGIVQVSRWQPTLIDPNMPLVYRVIVALLRGLRSHVTRVACQAARELFRTMQSTNRPEFDELVGALLGRTADLNRFIRHDANGALDAMVTYLPPQACVRALLARGCSNRHPLVRSTTARLLTCCSVVVGPGGLFAQCTKRDARTNLMSGAASLLADPNQETRSFAKKLFESLVQHDDFDAIFQSSVDEKIANKVKKAVALIKYNKHVSPT